MDLDEAIRGRRSVRKYKADAPVPREDIEAIIEAGCWAPSSTNIQPWRFIVVTDRETIASMAKAVYDRFQSLSKEALRRGERRVAAFCRFLRSYGSFFTDAPVVIVVCGKPYEHPVLKMPIATFIEKAEQLEDLDIDLKPLVVDTIQKSVSMAVQNLLLKAHSMGYGACVMDAPIAVESTLRKMLNIEDELRLLMVIPMGVPAHDQREGLDRMPVSEVTRFYPP